MTTDYQSISRDEAMEHGFLYWEAALIGPKLRGSPIRVAPDASMLRESGYCKKVRVMGEDTDVYFDAKYIEYYALKTGIDYRILWGRGDCLGIEDGIINSSQIAKEMVYTFLETQNVKLSDKLVRHAMLFKFVQYLERQNND